MHPSHKARGYVNIWQMDFEWVVRVWMQLIHSSLEIERVWNENFAEKKLLIQRCRRRTFYKAIPAKQGGSINAVTKFLHFLLSVPSCLLSLVGHYDYYCPLPAIWTSLTTALHWSRFCAVSLAILNQQDSHFMWVILRGFTKGWSSFFTKRLHVSFVPPEGRVQLSAFSNSRLASGTMSGSMRKVCLNHASLRFCMVVLMSSAATPSLVRLLWLKESRRWMSEIFTGQDSHPYSSTLWTHAL